MPDGARTHSEPRELVERIRRWLAPIPGQPCLMCEHDHCQCKEDRVEAECALKELVEQLEAKRRALTLAETNLGYAEERMRGLEEQVETLRRATLEIPRPEVASPGPYAYVHHDDLTRFWAVVDASFPASDSPGARIVRREREREALGKAHYAVRHETGSNPASRSNDGA